MYLICLYFAFVYLFKLISKVFEFFTFELAESLNSYLIRIFKLILNCLEFKFKELNSLKSK